MKKTLFRVFGVGLLAAGLASCGGGSSSPTASTSAATTTAATTTTAAATGASVFGTQFGIDYNALKTTNPVAVNSGDIIALTLAANPVSPIPVSN